MVFVCQELRSARAHVQEKTTLLLRQVQIHLFFNNHIKIISNTDVSDLAKISTPVATPFTLAAIVDTMTEGGVEALEDLDEALDY